MEVKKNGSVLTVFTVTSSSAFRAPTYARHAPKSAKRNVPKCMVCIMYNHNYVVGVSYQRYEIYYVS